MAEEKHEHKNHEHHEAHKHVYMEHKQHEKHATYKTATYVLGGLCILLLAGLIISLVLGGKGGSGAVSTQAAQEQIDSYLKNLYGDAKVDSVVDLGEVYAVKLTVLGAQYDSYASKDGKLLFPQGLDVTAPVTPQQQGQQGQQPTAANIPKSDKPVVELFIMSHCPYGTQAEKGMLPAVRTLGDTIDFKIKFVYYAMHGELEIKEQLTQYCIQSEQPDKYLKYLACFLNSTDGGSAATAANCLEVADVDTDALDDCEVDADKEFDVMANFKDQASWLNGRFPKFNTDLAANEAYGIGGSPTLIINGVEANAGRDSASYLKAICGAFNNAPEECETELSSTQPGPGFGYDSVGSAQAAGCGV